MDRGKLCNQLMRLGTHMATRFDREMSMHGVTQAQFRNLLELCHEPLAPGVLARKLMLEKPTVSLMVSKMTKSKLLERIPGSNRRTHLVKLTESGHQAIHEAVESAVALAGQVTSCLEDSEVHELTRLLNKVEEHLRSHS